MKGSASLRKEVKKYVDTADDKTLRMLHAMLSVERESDWWDDLGIEEKASIERGLKDAEAGRVRPHEAVMKKYQKWLSK